MPPQPPPRAPAPVPTPAKQLAEYQQQIGIANLPNQAHKMVYRNGAKFTILLVGESGLGKTTFVNTLFTNVVVEPKQLEHRHHSHPLPTTTQIEITKANIEEKGFRVELTVVDTPGFGDGISRHDAHAAIVKFLDDQHESYLRQEAASRRQIHHHHQASPKIGSNKNGKSPLMDMRVHACLYFISPHNKNGLRTIDIEAMKALSTRVNLIPVIAKADTLSRSRLSTLKDQVRDMLTRFDIQVYSSPLDSDDEETTKQNVDLMSAMPFAVIGATEQVLMPDGRRILGRAYKWGVAEVENDQHCDFRKLRSLLIRTHMHDLITTTEEVHYEQYRQQRLKQSSDVSIDPATLNSARQQFEQSIKASEQKFRTRLAERLKQEDARFRQWDQRLIAERARLMKNLESEHATLQALAREVETLNGRVNGFPQQGNAVASAAAGGTVGGSQAGGGEAR